MGSKQTDPRLSHIFSPGIATRSRNGIETQRRIYSVWLYQKKVLQMEKYPQRLGNSEHTEHIGENNKLLH